MIPSPAKYILPAGLLGASLFMAGMAVKAASCRRKEAEREIAEINSYEIEHDERMRVASEQYHKLEDAFSSYFNGDRRDLVGTYRDLMARTGIPEIERFHAVMGHVKREIDALHGSTLLQFEALVWVAHTAHERAITAAVEHFEYHKSLPEGEICWHKYA